MAILKPSGEVLFQGLTINEFTSGYNYELARSQGINAAILRATAGSNYTDLRFPVTVKRVQEAGMNLGFYHYLIAETEEEARSQARFFASTIADTDYNLRPAMLFEMLGDLSRTQANRVALAFLEEVESATGVIPVVYTNAELANNTWNSTIASRYPLWIIDPGEGSNPDLNSPWTSWVGWQYATTSDPACLVGGIPVSRFTADMRTEAGATGGEKKLICLTVAPGDTLYGIARLFNTTVNEIVALNQITNPNRIFPGQQLYLWVSQNVPYPCCDVYTVKRGDTLSAIGERFGVDWRRIASINQIANPNRIFPGQVLKLGVCE